MNNTNLLHVSGENSQLKYEHEQDKSSGTIQPFDSFRIPSHVKIIQKNYPRPSNQENNRIEG